MTRRLLHMLGALGLALAAGLAAPTLAPAPAQAAGCTGSGGVTVVVDYQGLGGGTEQGCATGSGTAYGLFQAVGTRMQEASRERGFVCRVNGVPASDPCVNASPADAYWGLFWSDGSGTWNYATTGARNLRVPAGGMVAWSWQGGGQTPPGVSARRTASEPSTPDTSPGGGGGNGGNPAGGGGGNGAATGSGGSGSTGGDDAGDPAASPSDDPTTDDGAGAGRRERAERRGDRTERPGRAQRRDRERDHDRQGRGAADDRAEASDLTAADGTSRADDAEQATGDPADPSGLPTWVPFVVLAVLAAGGAGALVLRRRTSGGS